MTVWNTLTNSIYKLAGYYAQQAFYTLDSQRSIDSYSAIIQVIARKEFERGTDDVLVLLRAFEELRAVAQQVNSTHPYDDELSQLEITLLLLYKSEK